jgi:hypothetical protein
MTAQAQAAQLGQVVLCLVSDGMAAGRAPAEILQDIQAACLARPELQAGVSVPEESETLVRARASVLAEGAWVAVSAPRAADSSRKLFEAKVDLLIQVAKRDALIEHAAAERVAQGGAK